MTDHTLYRSPFQARYASLPMQRLFSEQHKFETWRRLWVILAESQQSLGLPITDEQLNELRAHIADIDFEVARAHEQRLRHDVMAHVHTYGDACPTARPIIHLGATSCYVGDNADVMILRDALLLVRARLVAVARALHAFAWQHRDVPVLGFTHFQPAQPTTLGKRASVWLYDVLSDLDALEHGLSGLLPLGCKGTTGTQASFLALFDGDQDKVMKLDDMTAKAMGFARSVPVSGQTYSRKQDSRVLQLLSQIAQTAHKFSNDIRLLAHLKEVEEPFEQSQVGSSAMPYKRNPMRCERMAGIARFVIANALNGDMTAAEQWLERTLDDSANRRLSIAEGFLAVDGLLVLFDNIASGLVVYPKVIEKHLCEELPFLATEDILMHAVRAGGDRQTLHERIRQHAMAAGQRVKQDGLPNDLLERIMADPAFSLQADDLPSLMDAARFTGLAARQAREYLDGEARQILDKYADVQAPEEAITL
ncbi:MAG: adenylosuccinate lyase [Clostridiales bacterium]|nr:adenylosuccinate lyase [Clostridiales bacterium]